MDEKKWYTSKTVWIAVLQGVAGVVAAVATANPTLAYIGIGKSILDIVIRSVTDRPIG